MADTIRTRSEILALFPNNGTGDISAQDARDFIVSCLFNLIDDTTPQLGGNLDVNGNTITSASNNNIIINPDGTGAMITDIGGNARGDSAVDLQRRRTLDTQVASGIRAFIAAGRDNTASGLSSFVTGEDNESTANFSFSHGSGAIAAHEGQKAASSGIFATVGDAQHTELQMRNSTTDASSLELFADGSAERFTIEDEHSYDFFIRISARQDTGAAHASFWRRCLIERTGGTVSLVGSVATVGTDINTPVWSVVIAADDTNKAMTITVTGAGATNIRWVAHVQALEIQYAN